MEPYTLEGKCFMLCIICVLLMTLGGTESKRARLVDGKTPYEGRVEIYHGNQWLPVLYYSPGASQHDWSLGSADVVCKEAGYPGAMWHGKDDFALRNDERRRVYNVFCDAPKENLDDCTYNTGEHNSLNSTTATAVCQYDGYLGCYKDDTLNLQPFLSSDLMTIQLCLGLCRSIPDNNYMYVGLQAGYECYCITEEQYHFLRPTSKVCSSTCLGERSRACGGANAIGVYRSTMGACGGYLHESGTIYSFGFPGFYPENSSCMWNFTSGAGDIISLKFIIDEIDREKDTIQFTEMQDEINYRELDIKNGMVVSCTNFVRFTFVSSASNHLGKFAVAFQADNSNCQAPKHLENGNFYYNGSCPYFDGDTITFMCKEGYTLTSLHSKIVCLEDGIWNDTLPMCTNSSFMPRIPSTPFTTTNYQHNTNSLYVPTSVSTPTEGSHKSAIRTGTIVGAVFGVILLIIGILLVSIVIYRRLQFRGKSTRKDTTVNQGSERDGADEYAQGVGYDVSSGDQLTFTEKQEHHSRKDETGDGEDHECGLIAMHNGQRKEYGTVDNPAYEPSDIVRSDDVYTEIDDPPSHGVSVKTSNTLEGDANSNGNHEGTVDNMVYESSERDDNMHGYSTLDD
ncbi:uncharacterized protein [Ptychodera flava]|uniref:uncharacterized protein n=1 Tax=Ptychodera flava TaxID=63121 RepID=UPI00396AACEC